MDWTLAIEKNRDALKRVLAMLVAMVGVASGGSAGGQFTFFPQKGSDTSGQGQAEKSKLSPTLPRHLHRFVLRLLRPAEAAARRLIMVAARGLVVELSPPRPPKPKPLSVFVRDGVGTGIVRKGSLPDRVPVPPRILSLPLLDPLKRFGSRRQYVKPSAMPRIRSFDDPRISFFDRPREPDRRPLSTDDLLDARRLNLRLKAMASALDDLPRHAKRLARWQARRDAASAHPAEHGDAISVPRKVRSQRLSPMRPGRPPGWSRRPRHQVYEVLNELHGLAVWAMARPDTS